MTRATMSMLSLLATLAGMRTAAAQPEVVEPEVVASAAKATLVVGAADEPGLDAATPRPARVVQVVPVVDRPVAASTSLQRAPVPCEPERLDDPARGRLGLLNTAETLGKGQWSFTSRGVVTTEVAIGATDWLELGLRNIPVLMLAPDGVKNTLWMLGARWRVLRTSWLTLTAETEGLAFLGWGGLRGGLLSRMGGERAGFHMGVSGMRLWTLSDDGWATEASWEGEERTETKNLLVAQAGVDVRVGRRVKLMVDGSYFREDGPGLLVAASAVRVHGYHFAADFGLAFVHSFEHNEGFAVPLVNLSVSY